MRCSLCDAQLPTGARFCPRCGAPTDAVAATHERKVVSVLFADLVDSTALGRHLDAERARDVLGRFFDAVAHEVTAARGQVEKFIGDAAMAVFGVPRVCEDDALRAVRAGLVVVDSVKRLGATLGIPGGLSVRVGVETGEVAVGTGPAGQMLVTGPVVSTAARLQQAAQPDEVLVGDTTRALIADAATFGQVRSRRAKGFEAPLRGHPVTGLARRSVRRTIPLVGRHGELAAIHDAWALARSANRVHLVTVLGEAGMGKSRLVDDFVAQLPEDATVLVGHHDGSGGSTAFGAAADMLRRLAGVGEEGTPRDVLDHLSSLVVATVPQGNPGVLHGLGHAVGLDHGALDDVGAVREAQTALVDLLVALARRGPVAVVLEDLHLARTPVLDFVERLTWRSRTAERGMLVVATARPDLIDQRPRWGASATCHSVLRLEPLDAEASLELARRAGGQRIGAEATLHIAERASGNPFFIIESTGMLLEGGAGTKLEGVLPPTVQAVVAARLDQLEPRLRAAARRVSVFAEPFGVADAAVVGGVDVDELTRLVDAEVLAVDAPGRWRFRHQILREVAYSGLPKRERLALHTAVADMLEAGGHAGVDDHLELAAQAALDLDPTDRSVAGRAVDTLLRAGERGLRRMEPRRTVDRNRRALALAGPEDTWGVREARGLAQLGEALYWLSDYRASVDALSRAESIADEYDDDVTMAQALRLRADIVLNVDGRTDEAEVLFARSLDAAERLGDPRAMSLSLLFAGWLWWHRDDFAGAKQRWVRALQLARQAGDRWAETRALTAVSVADDELGDIEGATRMAEESLRVARDVRDPFSAAVAMVQLGRTLRGLERPEEALTYFDQAAAIYEEVGARWELADALYARGGANEQLRRFEAAEADLQAAVRLSTQLGERLVTRWASRALERVVATRAAGS